MGEWFAQNWFTLLSAVGVITSLLFAADSLRAEAKTRRIANLLTITQGHREIWQFFSEHPELSRVPNPFVNLAENPVTRHEEIFAILVLLHLTFEQRL